MQKACEIKGDGSCGNASKTNFIMKKSPDLISINFKQEFVSSVLNVFYKK